MINVDEYVTIAPHFDQAIMLVCSPSTICSSRTSQ